MRAKWTTRRAEMLLLAVLTSCVSAPRPTEEALRREANPRATVSGVVRDEEGHPVAGIQVLGLPRDRDLGWSPAAVTDAAGRFRLVLIAPGNYGFLLSWNGRTVVTQDAGDPALLRVSLRPGEEKPGIELTFQRRRWERALAESGQTPPLEP